MKKLIITGAPRTGTTAIATILSQSEKILVTHELAIYDNDPKNFWKKREEVDERRDEINEKLLKTKNLNMKDIEDFFVGDFKNKGSIEFFGDKFPTYCTSYEYCKRLVRDHHDAYFIFTYRNPCAILNSYIKRTAHEADKNTSDWFFKNLTQSTDQIIEYNYNWSKYIYPYVDKKIIIHYDMFINKPRQLIKTLENFLNTDIHIEDIDHAAGHMETFDTGVRGLFEHSNPDEFLNRFNIFEINHIANRTSRLNIYINRLIKQQKSLLKL